MGGEETGAAASVDQCTGCASSPDTTTSYLHANQVGSNTLLTVPSTGVSGQGNPVWQYLPFGDEQNAHTGVNEFKFGPMRAIRKRSREVMP